MEPVLPLYWCSAHLVCKEIRPVSPAAAAAAKSLQSCLTLCNPIDGSHQAPPSLGFSRQEHWSGLPFPPPVHESEKWKWSHSVVSDSSRPHGLQPTRLLHPWDFPGKSTGVGCHCLLRVSPKGNQSWIFIGRTDTEAEAPILWLLDEKRWLIGKDSDWVQKEKWVTENEIVGWHHWLNGHEFEQSPGDSEGQGSLMCCSSWDHKESKST